MYTKDYLLAPGPTPVPTRIIKKMARPIIHHRTEEFMGIFKSVKEKTEYLFQTKTGKVIVFPGSGTAGLESAIANMLSPGDKVLTLEAGWFGERWSKMNRGFGAEVTSVKTDWGYQINPDDVRNALEKDRDIKAVFATLNETSTSVTHDIKAISEVTNAFDDVLMIVDGISGIGCLPCPMDEWNLDVVITASQKGLMCPPGIALVGLSQKALKAAEKSDMPKFFFDYLAEIKKNEETGQTRFTPPVSLIIGLEEALTMFQEEGIENVLKRHEELGNATREALKAMGLNIFAKEGFSNSLTAVWLPEDIQGEKGKEVPNIMRKDYNVTIAGGQEHLKGKIVRFGHMGYVDKYDIATGLMALAMTLKKLGCSVNLNAALEAFQG